MLRNTFCHLTGIGFKRERQLWSLGITSWNCLLKKEIIPFSKPTKLVVENEITQSFLNLENKVIQYFTDRLSLNDYWRLISEFYDSIVYLDIETTGLYNTFDYITTIALYDGESIFYYIHGENLQEFKEDIKKYKIIVTFNGKCFDIPFIESYFNIKLNQTQIDLRFLLKSLGYKGGLKNCERQLGVQRNDLDGINGFLATLLWNEFKRNKNYKALESLLSYNIEDAINLESLMVKCYNLKIRNTPFSKSHALKIPKKPVIPFSVDLETISKVQENISKLIF